MTGPDARIHVEARPKHQAVRLVVSAPSRPDVRLDMDADAVRELAAVLLDSLAALDGKG